MTKTVLLATAAVFALSAGGIASAAVHTPTAGIHSQFAAPRNNIDPKKKKAKVLYNQNSNDSSDGVDSQHFGTSFPTYDSYGADDFQLKKAGTVTEVEVTGQYFNGSGPATSENVIFYSDNGGVPGAVLQTFSNVKGTGSPSFTIKLKKGIKLAAATTYWVTVQANLAFDSGGEWAWEVNSKLHGNQAQWQNPGGGFAVCPTWGTIETCVGSTGPDFMFELLGK